VTVFQVWAPGRDRVRIQVDGSARELRRTDGGWWRVELAAGPGTDYAYLLDDDDTPLPDPRSLWQPNGVHAASRVYRPESFAWTDQAWTGRGAARRRAL